MRRPSRMTTIVAALLAGVLSGCSGSSVGGGVQVKSSGKGCLSLGCDPSASPSVTPQLPVATRPPSHAPTATRPPVVTASTQRPPPSSPPQAKPFTITINGDRSGKDPIDPVQAAVYVGQKVIWVNHDAMARSIVANDKAFVSPLIPPGGSYTWVASKLGQHNYGDGTRPYVSQAVLYVRNP